MREPMLVLDRGDQYVTIGTGGVPTVWMVKPNGVSTPMTDRRNAPDLVALIAEHWPMSTGQATAVRCECGVRTEARIPDQGPLPDLMQAGREAFAEHVAEVIRDAVAVVGRDSE